MAAMDLTQHVLALDIAGYALGGVIMGVAVFENWRAQVGLALVLSITCFLLFQSDAQTSSLFITPVGDAPVFLGAGLAMLVAARVVFGLFPGLRRFLRRTLRPQEWLPQPAQAPTDRDLSKRWFVTVSAATGALVAMLMRRREFWDLVLSAFNLSHFLFTFLIIVASFTLIGPVEDYIFDAAMHDDSLSDGSAVAPLSRLERLLSRPVTWRAGGRLLLVVILVAFYPVLLGCVETQFHSMDTKETTDLIAPCIVPALVTYYWSAALQRGAPSIARSAGSAATMAFALMTIPATLILYGVLLIPSMVRAIPPEAGPVLMVTLITVIVSYMYWFTLVFIPFAAAFAAGVPAVIGGAILGRQRRLGLQQPIPTIALISLAVMAFLALSTLAQYGAASLAMSVVRYVGPPLPSLATALSYVAGAAGWGVGLIVSGFPDIFRRAIARPNGQMTAPLAVPSVHSPS